MGRNTGDLESVRPRWALRAWVFVGALPLVGCDQGDLDLLDVDPEAAPATPTWSAHVEPILHDRCTACHGDEAQFGAAEGWKVDTCERARAGFHDIWETAAVGRSMPPGGANRLMAWELLTLQRWHEQGGRCD